MYNHQRVFSVRFGLTIGLVLLLRAISAAEEAVFVQDGKAVAAYSEGKAQWRTEHGLLTCGGEENYLVAEREILDGDFTVTADLVLKDFAKSAASVQLGSETFGFEGAHGKIFGSGSLFREDAAPLGNPGDFIIAGKPFRFEATRRGKTWKFSIDGETVYETEGPAGRVGRIALRPWRSTMGVKYFAALGNLRDAPKPLPRTQADGYTIPVLDISDQEHRQVVIARGTDRIYQGHPDTLLMPDGETMFAVWTYNHGGECGPMKKSTDGGLTWGDLLPVPDNWKTIRNCPTIHRALGPDGKERLIVMAGNGAMHQSISLDQGKTWTPMEPNGLHCVVAPMNLVELSGNRLFAAYHRGPNDRDRSPLRIWYSISEDGGRTWAPQRPLGGYQAGSPCEPFVIKRDKQLLVLCRENQRKYNSILFVSNDEGETWSEGVELPAALTGDRHNGVQLPDGRWVLAFRDTTRESPTRGDFVAWVGTYDDIVNLREGQYRVRLLNGVKKFDLGYPGVELLPDGTIVATTYAVLAPGEKNSVVSVRFKVEELDAMAEKLPKQDVVYRSGEGGYHTYRIPSVLVTKAGTVLAFCEGRKDSRSDTGDIDLLLRRSTDGGETFGKTQVVWDDGPNTCGNPCPVVDQSTGTIWLLLTHNLGVDHESQIKARTSKGTRTVWVSKSTDDGATWSKPVEITPTTKKPDWTWYATGPGAGIQLKSGRLLIPCDHIVAGTDQYNSHVIYSDDGGAHWKLGGVATPFVNECEAVELADGRVMLNMRNYDRNMRCRAVATSDNRGDSWSEVTHDETLIEPICQASIRRYSLAIASEKGKDRILFSNPASETARVNMTLRVSYDEGGTWPVAKTLHAGPSAYSCLAVLPGGDILCLYERGAGSPYETIVLARVRLNWLEEE